jgi:hypothetical protein
MTEAQRMQKMESLGSKIKRQFKSSTESRAARKVSTKTNSLNNIDALVNTAVDYASRARIGGIPMIDYFDNVDLKAANEDLKGFNTQLNRLIEIAGKNGQSTAITCEMMARAAFRAAAINAFQNGDTSLNSIQQPLAQYPEISIPADVFGITDDKYERDEISENEERHYRAQEIADIAPELVVKMIGTWIWITGPTWKYSKELKAVGAKFNGKRKCWYVAGERGTRNREGLAKEERYTVVEYGFYDEAIM